MLKPRNLIESFSTFIQFNDNGRFQDWQRDIKLDYSMQRCLERETSPSTALDYWIRYWHQIWQNQPQTIARDHLFAYVQELCYQMAEQFWSKYQSLLPQNKLEKIEDYFQVAIAKTDTLLNRFNPQYPTANFRGLATTVFFNKLIDHQRYSLKYFGLTDWSLLKHTSSKKLVEALQKYGLSGNIISSYLLAWECYKILYSPTKEKGNNKLKEPDRLTWQKIVQAYQQQKTPQDLECNTQIISAWLKTCAIAIRNIQSPIVESLNQVISTEGSIELQDTITSDTVEDSPDFLSESQALKQQIHQILIVSFQELQQTGDSEILLIFQLYYCQKPQLKQSEIAERVFGNVRQQFKVSRRLDRLKRKLLTSVSKWISVNQKVSLNTDAIQSIDRFLDDWLIHHSQEICRQFK